MFWADEVRVGSDGDLMEQPSFTAILNEMKRHCELYLVCGGSGPDVDEGSLHVRRLGYVLNLGNLLRNFLPVWQSLGRIRREVAGLPNKRYLIVDFVPAALLAASVFPPFPRGFFYVRGDDAKELLVRQRGIKKALALLPVLGIWVGRYLTSCKMGLIGAGSRPVSRWKLCRGMSLAFFPTSVRPEWLAAPDQARRSTPPGGSAGLTLVGVGRFTAIKRFSLLLAAADVLHHAESVPVRVVLVGDGPQREELERQAAGMAPGVEVIFRGYKSSEETRDEIRKAHALVISSRWEGFPKTLAEAVSQGTPVISTPVGSIPDFVRRFEVGEVVRPSSKALAHAMKQWLENPERWEELRTRCLQVAPDLTIEQQSRRLVRFLSYKDHG